MADILIRGMEIPKNCSSCKIICWNYLEYGINGILAKLSTSESRDPNCPLVPLPEGHGRMIDADALVSKYTEEVNKLEEWAKIHEKEGRLEMFRGCHLRSAYIAEAKLNIEAAPTIVPAEGGADNADPAD